jgi:Fe-S cluster assembly protein SufD
LIEDAAHRLIFANGRLASAQLGDLPEGVILGGLADLLRDRPELLEPHIGRLASIARRPMAALNAAWIEDGLVLIVPRSAAIHGVIEATFIASDNAPVSHPRHLIVLGENAEAVLVERHVGGATGGFTNAVTEITLGSGARLGHYMSSLWHRPRSTRYARKSAATPPTAPLDSPPARAWSVARPRPR